MIFKIHLEIITSHDEACVNHYQPLLEQQLGICKELSEQYENVNETIEERYILLKFFFFFKKKKKKKYYKY